MGIYFDINKQIIYVGDYDSKLYIINIKYMKIIKKIDFKRFFKKNQELGVLILSLYLLENNLLITTRLNKLFKMDIKTYEVKTFLDIKEDICDVSVYKKSLLIGIRYGELYIYNFKENKLNKREKTGFIKRKYNLENYYL